MKKTLRLRPACAWVTGTLLLCLTATVCHAQTDTISGVINRYTLVTFFECTNNAAFNVRGWGCCWPDCVGKSAVS